MHRLRSGLRTYCDLTDTDTLEIKRWTYQEVSSHKVSCFLCLAES